MKNMNETRKTHKAVAALVILAALTPLAPPASADHTCTQEAQLIVQSDPVLEDVVSCVQETLDGVNTLPLLGFSVAVHAPNYVHAGDSFSVVVELTVDAFGATIVQMLPLPVAGPCTVTEFSIQGGVPLPGNYYFLTSDVSMPYLVDDGDPAEYMNGLDMQMTLETTEDVVGDCKAGVLVSELANQVAGRLPREFSDIIPVVLPAPELVLGKIVTMGGHGSMDDRAEVILPAVPLEETGAKYPVVVLTSDPQVSPKGTIGHHEAGPTWYDDGYFEIRQNGGMVNQQRLTRPTETKILAATTSLPHEKGKTIDTRYCLYGVYVDGGVGTDYEGPKETCMIVAATEAADPAQLSIVLRSFGSSTAQACATFSLPTTQAAIQMYGNALVPIVPLTDPTKAVDGLGHYLFGPEFGEECP
jgi:hypothetical protein